MLRTIVEARVLVAMLVAAGVGTWGLHVYPVRTDDVLVADSGQDEHPFRRS